MIKHTNRNKKVSTNVSVRLPTGKSCLPTFTSVWLSICVDACGQGTEEHAANPREKKRDRNVIKIKTRVEVEGEED